MSVSLHFGLLGPLSMILPLLGGSVALDARRHTNRDREAQLKEAIRLLRVHCEAMEKLDNADTPVELLEFSVRLSRVLHDPEMRASAIRVLMKERDEPTPIPQASIEQSEVIGDAFNGLMARRPDLATAFMQSLVSGIVAFEKRWPECADALIPGLSEIVESPIEQAQKIVRASVYADYSAVARPPIAAIAA